MTYYSIILISLLISISIIVFAYAETIENNPDDLQNSKILIFDDNFENMYDSWIDLAPEAKHWWMWHPRYNIILPWMNDELQLVASAKYCFDACVMKMKNSIDLTPYSTAELSFWASVVTWADERDFFSLDFLDGDISTNILTFSYNSSHPVGWNSYTFDLANYLNSTEFNLVLTMHSTTRNNIGEVGHLQITGTKIIDNSPPEISLLGPNPQFVYLHDSYTEYGSVAVDDVDGDITDDIIIDTSSIPDELSLGTYLVKYTVMDSTGNLSSIERTIHVYSKSASQGLIQINDPLDEFIFTHGESIDFWATVFDLNDGYLGDKIQWYSNIDGYLGTGKHITVNDLSPTFSNMSDLIRIHGLPMPAHEIIALVKNSNGDILISGFILVLFIQE